MGFPRILLLLFLPLLTIANARMLSPETELVDLKDTTNIKDNQACQDCIHIIEILKHLLLDEEFQMKLKSTLEEVCDLLPEQFIQPCRSNVEQNLPLALTFLTGLMDPEQVCAYLCEGKFKLHVEDILMNYIQRTIKPPSAMLETSFPCNACTYALNVLNCLLPIAQTESVVISVLDEVCSLLPILLSGQCSRLVQRSVKKLFEVLLNAASPNSICSVLRLCQSSAPRIMSPLLDCDSCLTLVVLSHLSLGSNATQPQVTSFLRSVCQLHPGVLPKCESFTQRYGEQLQGILGKKGEALDVCEYICVFRELSCVWGLRGRSREAMVTPAHWGRATAAEIYKLLTSVGLSLSARRICGSRSLFSVGLQPLLLITTHSLKRFYRNIHVYFSNLGREVSLSSID